MASIPLNELLPVIIKVFSSPVIFMDSILSGIRLEWITVGQVIAQGEVVTMAMLLPLIKNLVILIFAVLLVIFMISDTVIRVLLAGIGAKSFFRILSDILVVIIALVFYYVVIALAVYGFFNIILPLYETPPTQ